MTMILANSYSDADRSMISSAYTNLDDVATAIESHDESVASVEDLLSYYIENTGALPDFMTGVPSPDEVDDLWVDSDFIGAVQDWRQSNTGQGDMTTLISQLENFLQAGEASGIEDAADLCDFSIANDTTGLINEWYAAHPTDSDSTTTGSSGDGSGVLLTDMMTIALKMGNPGLAILFYIMGSDTEIDASTLVQNEDQSWSYQDTNGGEHTIDAEGITANSDGTYTIQTENGPVTIANDEVTVFHNTGLGQVVMDFQDADLDTFNDLQDEIANQTEDLGGKDYTLPETTGEVELIKADIDRAKNIADVYTKLLQSVQDILDSLVEAASSLIDRQTRTFGAIASRI